MEKENQTLDDYIREILMEMINTEDGLKDLPEEEKEKSVELYLEHLKSHFSYPIKEKDEDEQIDVNDIPDLQDLSADIMFDIVMGHSDSIIVPLEFNLKGYARLKTNDPLDGIGFIAENYDEIVQRSPEINLKISGLDGLKIPSIKEIKQTTLEEHFGEIPKDVIVDMGVD